jgi:amino acid permease
MAASPNAADTAAAAAAALVHTDNANDDASVVNEDINVGVGVNVNGSGSVGSDVRIGTISSARFNILSTMVGGGCLSLPLAFQQSGNALIGPLMLLATGAVTEFCFRNLVKSAVVLHRPHPTTPGRDTFESISHEAFGPKAYLVSMGLVVLMCFFGTVGYSVLLRDMMEPLNDAIAPKGLSLFGLGLFGAESSSEWLHRNFTMFLVVVVVTPFCTLRRLTALKDCGAASMISLLVLGSCIVIRSVQCNLGTLGTNGNAGFDLDLDADLFWDSDGDSDSDDPWYTHLRLFPDSWHDLLNALPLYISCFVCHYNILPVHNELKDPSAARVSWWLRSTTWFAVALYMVMGFAGSAYAHCTPSGKIQGSKYLCMCVCVRVCVLETIL